MTQRAALTQAEKQHIIRQKEAGVSLRQISIELGCSFETVRKWWRNSQKKRPVRQRGRPQQGPLSTYPKRISEEAIRMKKEHPHWGPKMIQLELEKELLLNEKELPSSSRLSVLFKQRCPDAVQPREQRQQPPSETKVNFVHQRWQMDAKEGILVGTERVNVQEIRDIYSGLMIASQAFVTTTPKRWRRLHRDEHQQVLRQAFSQWGLPLELQTDNDGEFINLTDHSFPSLFTLWLVGLGINHILSRPHRPTDQPQVERNHRTQGDFVWKDKVFEHVTQLQQTLDYHCQLYNQKYPSTAAHCHGKPPLAVFPSAISTGRTYHPDLEWTMFNLDRVDAFLAQFVWTRKAAKNGIVHLGNHFYYVGNKKRAQTISVRFLPACRSFHFQLADGSPIKDLPALGLEKDHMIGSIPDHVTLQPGFQYSFPLPGV